MTLPLEGIRVLDLSRILAGPYCTQYLGDMGAEVIKVEPPDGDDTRTWGPPFADGGESIYFMAINRNKRGIVIDLRTQQGQDILRRLLADVDVLVENFRPGTLERWSLGYEQLAKSHPQLIHCAISGFGQTGRYRHRPGYDLIAQGMGGVMGVTGEPDGPPMKVGFPVADLNAGTWSIIAILMALHARQRTGRGQYIDLSLMECQIAWNIYNAGLYHYRGISPGRAGSAHHMIAPYQAYEAKDGWINVGVASQKLWRKFCALLELDIVDDPRFADNPARVTHRDDLNALVEPRMRQRTMDEWLEAFDETSIPAGPIYSMEQLYSDPYVEERNQVVRMPHPVAGTYIGTGFPAALSDTPAAAAGPPPTHGQHTVEVLTELGVTAEQLEQLIASNVVSANSPHGTPQAGDDDLPSGRAAQPGL